MSETTLLPVSTEVEVGGRTLVIKEVNTKQLIQILPHLEILRSNVQFKENGDVDIAATLAECPDALIGILAAACNIPKKELEEMDPFESIKLLDPVLKANSSFFIRLATAGLLPSKRKSEN
jgi:hypothetical protein